MKTKLPPLKASPLPLAILIFAPLAFEPPPPRESVPALTLTVPVLANGSPIVVVPAAFLLYVPAFENVPAVPPNALLRESDAVSVNVPLFVIEPPLPVRICPPVHVIVPWFTIARWMKSCVAVVIASVAPLWIDSVPAPFMLPPLQVEPAPVRVNTATPPTFPPDNCNRATETPLSTETDPVETCAKSAGPGSEPPFQLAGVFQLPFEPPQTTVTCADNRPSAAASPIVRPT